MTAQVVGAILRAGIQLLGGAGLVSGDEIERYAGAVAVIVTLSWSIFEKYQRAKARA